MLTTGKTVAIIGSGGREAALAWRLAQSSQVSKILRIPGNAETIDRSENIPFVVQDPATKVWDFRGLGGLLAYHNVDMTVVGPEAFLAAGGVDHLNANGNWRVVGPTQRAARLEADKFFSYDVMTELGIPQANSAKCQDVDSARRAIDEKASLEGVVLKARGLHEGKGVQVFDSKEAALVGLEAFVGRFGSELLVSERLSGQEYTVIGISDGNKTYPMRVAIQDHKPLLDGDRGPNTGGMGIYAPASFVTPEIMEQTVGMLNKVVGRMYSRGGPYKGFLYAGMMLTKEGPKVLEFNARMGDPECQALMMLLDSDPYNVFSMALGAWKGEDGKGAIGFKPGAVCGVVLAAQGYPGPVTKGTTFYGVEEANRISGAHVFHAGTALKPWGETNLVVTHGGRVLLASGYSAEGLANAREIAYQAADLIAGKTGEGVFQYRKDIGLKGLE